jgi:hypothetical protein
MRKEMDDLGKRLNVVQTDVKGVQNDTREVKDEVKQVKLTQEEFIRNLMVQVARQNDVVDDLCHRLNTVTAEMECLTKKSNEKSEWFAGRSKIFVCGGQDHKCNLNSVESYSWPENSWTVEPAMKRGRLAPSTFVHERQIYVSGGWTGTEYIDTIESMNVDEENIAWIRSPLRMPIKCNGHKMVSHENSVILTGGRDKDNVSDGIYEIKLNPPYTSKLLTQLPEPTCGHGCHIIDNQVVVAGGRTSTYAKDTKNTVYVYDMNNNECKTLPPLPSPIANMASVSYKGNVILIGGANEKAQTLNSVVMYDVKTGKIKMLPCLNHKRAGSAAVITGNVIIVMGGYDFETKTCLSSVECLDLSSNVWRELSPMTTKRAWATAVIKPIS